MRLTIFGRTGTWSYRRYQHGYLEPLSQRTIRGSGACHAPATMRQAQQAMLDEPPLPWVPDVLGGNGARHTIIIVGSAYAPFVQGISNREATMPLLAYRSPTADEFLPSFLEHVVRPDADYYNKIALLANDQGTAATIALFDLCRASFTVRGTRVNRDLDRAAESTFKAPKGSGQEGQARAAQSRQTFTKYVESTKQREWTKRRLEQTLATRILALGSIAEHGLLKFFYDAGIRDITNAPNQSRGGRPTRRLRISGYSTMRNDAKASGSG